MRKKNSKRFSIQMLQPYRLISNSLLLNTNYKLFAIQCLVFTPEIVENDAVAVVSSGRQDDGGRRVRLTGHPGTVEDESCQEYGYYRHHHSRDLKREVDGSLSAVFMEYI